MHEPPTDWELAARARDGDRAAFADLVRRYEAPVRAFCRRMTGSAEDAEDLAQECFVRVYRYLPRLTPRARFSTAIFGMARNLALNHLRDERRRGRHAAEPLDGLARPAPDAGRPDVRAGHLESAEAVEAGLRLLSPEHREAVVLRDVHGLDYGEIARIVRCRRGTVKSRLARAREQLRRHLIEAGVERP